jgi:hypothetical protein
MLFDNSEGRSLIKAIRENSYGKTCLDLCMKIEPWQVWDRWAITEKIYGKVLREKDNISIHEHLMKLKCIGGLCVFLMPTWAQLLHRYAHRGDRKIDEETLASIYLSYGLFLGQAISIVPTLVNPSVQDVLERYEALQYDNHK